MFLIRHSVLHKCPTLQFHHLLVRLAHAQVSEGTNPHTEPPSMDTVLQTLADFVVTLDELSLHIARGIPMRITMTPPMTVTNSASAAE